MTRPMQGEIIEVYPPKWKYEIILHIQKDEDGNYLGLLTYVDGTPLPDDEQLKILQEYGLIDD